MTPTESSDIADLLRLARLRLEPGEEQRLASDLERILAYVRKLDELDEEPGQARTDEPTPLRPDAVGTHLDRAKALSNAPEHDGESFVVPRVV